MTTRTLRVQMNGFDVGRLERDTHGRGRLVYDESWRGAAQATPLSLSLPLAASRHEKLVGPYLWGLLPDNEAILEAWGKRFHVSARNAFGLLARVGADCPGAVQLLTEEAVETPPEDHVAWLDEAEVAERLRRLRRDQSVWRDGDDAGQFSLGGAQAKTAFLFENGRWGIPSGRIPTTHILKPGLRELDGHAENEHFCLSLMRELGLPVARSSVARFEDQTAIVVERYDRVRAGNRIVRVHQEDFCQATGTMPSNKYQNEGGPSARTIVELLRAYSSKAEEDVSTFIDALVVAWATAGTDGHAKNYSLLHSGGGKSRLAPLYDVASILPYTDAALRRTKLAMSIGGKYKVNEIGSVEWRKFADEMKVAPEVVQQSLRRIVAAIPDAAATVRRAAEHDGLDRGVVRKLAGALAARARSLPRDF